MSDFVTLSTYSHLMPADEEVARGVLNSALPQTELQEVGLAAAQA